MIDTVVLNLDLTKIKITKSSYDLFTPSAKGFFEPPYYSFGSKKVIKCILNASKEQKKRHIYLPRITLYKAVRHNGISIFMHIEFSAPKILFNNNFDELNDNDFDNLCRELAKKLRAMGIPIFSEQLKSCEVKAIHYGKNLVINDYSTASSIISELSESNISIRKNADIRAYKNNGEALHFYTLNKGVVIYDKINELNKSKITEKGLLEKDNYCQLSLFNERNIKRPFEVIRIETRYNNKKAIKDILNKLNIEVESYKFKDLYSSQIAKQILKYEFGIIESGIIEISKNKQSIIEFAHDIQLLNPNSSSTTILKAIALKSLMQETGSRDIRKILSMNSNQWSRLISNMQNLHYEKTNLKGYEKIRKKLEEFKLIKLSDYEDKIAKQKEFI